MTEFDPAALASTSVPRVSRRVAVIEAVTLTLCSAAMSDRACFCCVWCPCPTLGSDIHLIVPHLASCTRAE